MWCHSQAKSGQKSNLGAFQGRHQYLFQPSSDALRHLWKMFIRLKLHRLSLYQRTTFENKNGEGGNVCRKRLVAGRINLKKIKIPQSLTLSTFSKKYYTSTNIKEKIKISFNFPLI